MNIYSYWFSFNNDSQNGIKWCRNVKIYKLIKDYIISQFSRVCIVVFSHLEHEMAPEDNQWQSWKLSIRKGEKGQFISRAILVWSQKKNHN